MVSTEQIRFDKKERVKTEEGYLSQARVLLCPERTLSVGVQFGIRLTHVSDWSRSGSKLIC